MSKQYWFYIDSFVHVSLKTGGALFYNPYTGKILEFPAGENNDMVLKLTRKLLSPRNLRVIRLSAGELREPSIYRFVSAIREYFMGDLLDTSFSTSKPFQMPAQVKIQKNIKYLKGDKDRSVGEDMMNYPDEITLYLNDTCDRKCGMCSRYYCQVTCCTSKTPGNNALDIASLEKLFAEIQGCSLTNLNITGGDIFAYPYWSELETLLKALNVRKTFYVHYLNIAGHLNRSDKLAGSGKCLKMPVTFPLDEEKLKQALEAVCGTGLEAIPVFIIQGNDEYDRVEELLSRFPVESPVFVPFYNGNNLDFFEENFFISREDIEVNKPDPRYIYINDTVNAENFGKITILPDGRIHANVLAPTLGTLGKDSFYDCIFKEMKVGRSWRKLRRNLHPCKECNFEKLCPPVSNYNTAIGRYDLCHVHR